jgi:hypothetical protein
MTLIPTPPAPPAARLEAIKECPKCGGPLRKIVHGTPDFGGELRDLHDVGVECMTCAWRRIILAAADQRVTLAEPKEKENEIQRDVSRVDGRTQIDQKSELRGTQQASLDDGAGEMP